MLNKGDTFTDNKNTYTVVDTDKRSYILECTDGKRFKGSEKQIRARLRQVGTGTEQFQKEEYPNLSKRVRMMQLWRPGTTMPTNEAECNSWFEQLESDLSPENLSCDGELSRGQVLAKHREIQATWKELEKISGVKREPIY